MPIITFLEEAQEIRAEVTAGTTVLDAALAKNLRLFHDCGGNTRCTTCRVRIVDGLEHVSKRTAEEVEIARIRSWPDEIRLACQACTSGAVRVERLVRHEDQRYSGADPRAASRSEELPLAVLFCDINGFTDFASGLMPYDVVHVINRIFLRIGEAVLANAGYIDKYLGDGLLALWGVNGGTPHEHCLGAVRAALHMQHSVRELSRRLVDHFGSELSLRVGIHFGPAIVGRIGHPERQQLTAIGDTVNVAARVEAQNKELRTQLLITEECYEQISNDVALGDDFKTLLRGQTRPQRLFEIKGLTAPDGPFIVQSQIDQVVLAGEDFVNRFYDHLFVALPEIRCLFRGTNMPKQHELFLSSLAGAVRELRNPPRLREMLGGLGERHRGYGVRPEYYPPAIGALLQALEETLGDEFDDNARAAWRAAFHGIADTMKAPAAPRR
ncbi:MAG TPA: adenylate/guanylate cyclase domain-containing protein [Chthoniobacteraceae bacterium]|jgi:class 3 adenylate cyclase/hemoglobin-like flavoprotein